MQLTQASTARVSSRVASKKHPLLKGAARRPCTVHCVARPQVNAVAVETKPDWNALSKEFDVRSPVQILDHAFATFGDEIAIAFSGAEDVVLLEMARMTGRPFRVFSLDTGRLNAETYQFFDKVEKHFNIHIEYTFPEAKEVMDLVRAKGMFSFYEDGHKECCSVRKVKPLRRQLKTLKGWITGQRKDQSPGTRMSVPVVQVDPVFEGLTGGPGSLVKYNPLSNISSPEVWHFIRTMGLPYNAMHEHGFTSIGCEPCTKTVLPNQHEREGRWWWEDETRKECGLHAGNVEESSGGGTPASQRKAERDLFTKGDVVALTPEQARAIAAGQRDADTLICVYAQWCPFCQAMEGFYETLAADLKAMGSKVVIAKYHGDVDREFSEANLALKTFPTIVMALKGKTGVIKYPSERRDPDSLKMWIRTVAGLD